jgi:acyl carrier protein
MGRPELIEMFRTLATEIAERDFSHIKESDNIKDLGIDSLAMLELIGSMERELSIQVPDELLVGLVTVSQLLELVESKIPEAAVQT